MSTAGSREPRSSPTPGSERTGIWVEDGLILASALALGAFAFRVPLGLDGLPARVLLGATLVAMSVVAVLRVRRLVRQRGARTEGAPGVRKDGSHAD